jgi:hypothetical protein
MAFLSRAWLQGQRPMERSVRAWPRVLDGDLASRLWPFDRPGHGIAGTCPGSEGRRITLTASCQGRARSSWRVLLPLQVAARGGAGRGDRAVLVLLARDGPCRRAAQSIRRPEHQARLARLIRDLDRGTPPAPTACWRPAGPPTSPTPMWSSAPAARASLSPPPTPGTCAPSIPATTSSPSDVRPRQPAPGMWRHEAPDARSADRYRL